jgi:hypothetical protein
MYLTKFIATDARFEDYLTNPSTRLSSYISDSDYLKNIGDNLKYYVDSSKLLLRAKIVKSVGDSYQLNIVQVWATEKDRNNFSTAINDQLILDSFDFEYRFEKSEISNIDDIIDEILLEDNYLFQYLHSSYLRDGIVVDDPIH